MEYGTWTTFDVPTGGKEVQLEALRWLEREGEKIGASVRVKWNSHDFGRYPSFEIDCDWEDLEEEAKKVKVNELNAFEERYIEAFKENL